jgi:hypothetical protein
MHQRLAHLQFVIPWDNIRQEDCIFYHSFDFPDGTSVSGDWDMRGKFDAYVGGVNFKDKRVIDFGTASGFLSFEAEKRGASVVSFDADSTSRYTRLPHSKSRHATEPEEEIAEANKWLDGVKRSYWYAYHAFGSKNKVAYGNIYDLPPQFIGAFDVAILGQFLVHNRSGIDVLQAVAKSTNDYMIITEGVWQVDEPAGKFIGSASRPTDYFSNWIYSPGFYYEVMSMLGFKCESFNTATFYCGHVGHERDMELGVFVFRRT